MTPTRRLIVRAHGAVIVAEITDTTNVRATKNGQEYIANKQPDIAQAIEFAKRWAQEIPNEK